MYLFTERGDTKDCFNDMCEANANPFFFFYEWNSALKNTIGIVVKAWATINHSPAGNTVTAGKNKGSMFCLYSMFALISHSQITSNV